MLSIALWDEAILDFFARSLHELDDKIPSRVTRTSRRECRDLLVSGDVDIALIPTLSAVTENELFDILSAVALSTWSNPFTQLYLKADIGAHVDTVAIDPRYAQEALLAKIVLKEHYAAEPVFRPTNQIASQDVNVIEGDAALIIEGSFNTERTRGNAVVDLGQDWYELTHYPMLWGVFIMGKGAATDDAVRLLRVAAQYTELYSEEWVQDQSLSDEMKQFFKKGIRYRLDDLAIAGLTSLQDYMYYNNAVEEIKEISFYEVTEESDDMDVPLL